MLINEFKIEALRHLSQVSSFKNSWNNYKIGINHFLGHQPDGSKIFELGEHISECFQGNTTGGRSQSMLSSAGASWECLVTWYLNFVLWNTNVFVTKSSKKFVPEVIRDAMTVTISNLSTNTESDIVAHTVPQAIVNLPNLTKEDINNSIKQNINTLDLVIVQTKTNWNDDSQKPMLWDIVYNSGTNPLPNVQVGINGVSPLSFSRFAYAFVTVPSQKPQRWPGPDSIHVARVKNLSGGNYWGRPASAGVAKPLNEFFGKNFSYIFQGTVQNHIDSNINNDPTYLDTFLNLRF